MKTRSGFVSNSSSSSFVVPNRRWNIKQDKPDRLSKEEIDKLLDYGFKPCKDIGPSRIEIGDIDPTVKKCSKTTAEAYCYSVICNEDEVTLFLLTLGVTFSGSCHYGHYNYFYQKGKNYFLRIENTGLSYEIYFPSEDLTANFYEEHFLGKDGTRKVVDKINRKKWIKEETKFWDQVMKDNASLVGLEINCIETKQNLPDGTKKSKKKK